MRILIDEKSYLLPLSLEHTVELFQMIDLNRTYLRQWLNFVERMSSETAVAEFITGSMQRQQQGVERAFIIYHQDKPIGRIGVYKIDGYNRIGEIGYWIIEDAQGQGIVSKACRTLIDYCFDQLELNRIEIKCASGNTRSMAIPLRLKFKEEGIQRQTELLRDHFVDLHVFSLLKMEWGKED